MSTEAWALLATIILSTTGIIWRMSAMMTKVSTNLESLAVTVKELAPKVEQHEVALAILNDRKRRSR